MYLSSPTDKQAFVSEPSVAVSVPTISVKLDSAPTHRADGVSDGPQRAVGGAVGAAGASGGAMRTSGGGKGRKPSVTFALDVEEQKIPRCLSDPGPNKIEEEDEGCVGVWGGV